MAARRWWSLSSLVSGAVLLREAARSSRRWQTYAARAAFSGTLLGLLLLGMWTAVGLAQGGGMDAANLAWLGRSLFVGFSIVQILLAIGIAPLTTAAAIIEETDERTMEMLVLTPLSPGQILFGKLLSRILVLLTLVCGALPVMAMVVNLGGVGVYEVVAVTAHTLTAVVLMAALGGFFGLFTRSPVLAMMASAAYALPFFGVVPAAYVILGGGQTALFPRFSPFTAGLATDATAWITPLSHLPSLLTILALATPLFQLRVSNADVRHAFSDGLWRTTAWLKASAALVGVGILAAPPIVFATYGGWTSPGGRAVSVVAHVVLWLLFTLVSALGTWAYLRVGTDVVDGLDSLMSGAAPGAEHTRTSHTVWGSPVLWREARPRAWAATATPMLVTWALFMLGTFQTGWWLWPGGILAVGAGNAASAILFAAWLAARSITEERRRGTLEVLVATTLPAGHIVVGKLAGAMLPTLALLGPALPLLAIGVPHHRLMFGDGTGSWFGAAALGVAWWVWALPVWAFSAVLALTAATTVARSRSAFVVVALGLVGWFGAPAVLARAFPHTPIALVSRLVSPPLAGSESWVELTLSAAGYACLAAALVVAYTARMRSLVGALAAALLTIGLAAPLAARAEPPDPQVQAAIEQVNQLRVRARPLGDGIWREGRFTAVSVWIENGGPDTVATLALPERDAAGTVTFDRRVELPQGGRKQVQLLVRAGLGAPERTLAVTTPEGRVGSAWFPVRPVDASAVTVAVVGPDLFGLPSVRDATGEPVPGRTFRPAVGGRAVAIGAVDPSDLPAASAGWQAFDWVVWPAADPAEARSEQVEALRAWVADGGHLLLSVSDTWRQLGTSPLGEALPIALTGVRDGDVSELTEGLVGASGGGARVPVAVGAPRLDRPSVVRAATAEGDPLWISAAYGLGSVHLVLTDLDLAGVRGEERAWRRLLTLPAGGGIAGDLLASERGSVAGPVHTMLHLDPVADPLAGEESPDVAWEGAVRERLGTIPGVAPLPMSWLVGFSILYLLAIGPLDYLVLRAIGRQPWTWVTFPLLIAAFSGGSLAMTSYTKGSQAMVVRVEVVDLLPDAGLARGATWLGVFSTRKTSLRLTSGAADAVMAPLVEPGFQTDPRVSAGAGAGSLRYSAETWTLAYARSDWTGPARSGARGGGLEVVPTADGLALRNRLGFDLVDVAVQVPREGDVPGVHRLGALRDGGVVPLPEPGEGEGLAIDEVPGDLGWALSRFRSDRPATRGGLLAEARPVVVGVGRASVEPLTLEGLDPVIEPLVVVRLPLPAAPQSRATVEGEITVDRATVTCAEGAPVDGAADGRTATWSGAVGASCTVQLEGSTPDAAWTAEVPAGAGLGLRCGQDPRQDGSPVVCRPEGW